MDDPASLCSSHRQQRVVNRVGDQGDRWYHELNRDRIGSHDQVDVGDFALDDHPRHDDPVLDLPGTSLQSWHWIAILSILGLQVIALRFEGQRWWCRCGRLALWSGDIHSRHNSQHLLDPYSFTHALHGLLFYALLFPLARKLGWGTRLVLALTAELIWEIAENSDAVIERYRRATIAMGYSGDSVVNSLGDLLSCGVGFLLATRLPVRWSILLFVTVEAALLVVYRDCFLLNVLMLVCPLEAVKSWQMGR